MNEIDDRTLAVHRTGFLRPADKVRLEVELSRPEDLLAWSQWDVEWILGRRVKTGAWRPREYLEAAERDRKLLSRPDYGVVKWGEPGYSPLLEDLPDAPFLLFYRGMVPPIDGVLGAVVGTRHPTEVGREAALEAGRGLTRQGVGVVSGLAWGIDAQAHRGALEGGGLTWGVLGCGIDGIYPGAHRTLARRILDAGGGLLSEYGAGVGPRDFQFPLRNRIVSGLSAFTWVIQAPARSGALITAQWALDQGRDVMVHRRGLDGPTGEGTRALAQMGAPAVDSAEEVVRCWKEGPIPGPST